MKYDTVFPAFADRMVSRLAAIGAVGAAAAFLKWEWTVAAGICRRRRISYSFFLVHETALHPLGERKAGRGLHRPDGRRACRLPAFCGSGAGGGGGFMDTAFHSWLPGGLIVTVPCYYLGKAIVWNKNNIFLTSKKERG